MSIENAITVNGIVCHDDSDTRKNLVKEFKSSTCTSIRRGDLKIVISKWDNKYHLSDPRPDWGSGYKCKSLKEAVTIAMNIFSYIDEGVIVVKDNHEKMPTPKRMQYYCEVDDCESESKPAMVSKLRSVFRKRDRTAIDMRYNDDAWHRVMVNKVSPGIYHINLEGNKQNHLCKTLTEVVDKAVALLEAEAENGDTDCAVI